MRPSKIFFINSAAREHYLLGKLARELQKAADPCFKAKATEKSSLTNHGITLCIVYH